MYLPFWRIQKLQSKLTHFICKQNNDKTRLISFVSKPILIVVVVIVVVQKCLVQKIFDLKKYWNQNNFDPKNFGYKEMVPKKI